MNQYLPVLTPKKVLRALLRAGFFVHHTSGSHYILKHNNKPNMRITLAYHTKDLKRRVLGEVIKQAGMTVEEFLRFL